MNEQDATLTLIDFEEDGTPTIPFSHRFPRTMARALESLPTTYYSMTEMDLASLAKPNYVDMLAKKRVWEDFAVADKTNDRMVLKRALHGVCQPKYLTDKMRNNPAFAAWMIVPIASYTTVIDGFVSKAKERYADLIEMSIFKYKDGEPTQEVDPKKAAVLLSVIKNLEDRSIGMALQRSISIKTDAPKADKIELDAGAVDQRLRELEIQLGEKSFKDNDGYVKAEVINCDSAPVQQLVEDKERSEKEND